MKSILHIDSSITGEHSVSKKLTAELVEKLQRDHPDAKVVHRDLEANKLPSLDATILGALSKGERTIGDTLIEEIEAADAVVIGAPMYNFSVPVQLKTWFDHIARAGRTFRYTEQGPQGLLTGKKVYVVSTSGGVHHGKSSDGVEPWLRTMLNFLGLGEDLNFVHAEGLAMSDRRETAISNAEHQIHQLAERHAA